MRKHQEQSLSAAGAPFQADQVNTPPAPTQNMQKDQDGQTIAPGVRRQFHRTKLCKHFLKGNCLYGDECTYAHTQTDVNSRPDLRKTKLCQRFMSGQCRKSSTRCDFAHTLDELKCTDGIYKTVLCSWYMKGNCGLGDKCRFAHGDEELRPMPNTEAQPHSVPNILRRPPGKNFRRVPREDAPQKPCGPNNPTVGSASHVQAPMMLSGPAYPGGPQFASVLASSLAAAAQVASQPTGYSPEQQQWAVAAAAAAAATAAMNTMQQNRVGNSMPQFVPQVVGQDMNQTLTVPMMTAGGQVAYSQPMYQYMSIPQPMYSQTSPASPSAPPPYPVVMAQDRTVGANNDMQYIEASDMSDVLSCGDSVCPSLPRALDLKGSTGNLNLLSLPGLGLRKGFASSPALTSLIGAALHEEEGIEERRIFPGSIPEEGVLGNRPRADSDPTHRAADELLQAMNSEQLLDQLRQIFPENREEEDMKESSTD